MKLRPYQNDCKQSVLKEWETNKSTLFVLPTGCVSGDTVIGLNRAGKGYSKTISEAFRAQSHKLYDEDIPTMVRSLVGNHIGLHSAQAIVFSGRRKVWELKLENGKSIKATADHEILTSHGFKRLGALSGLDSVICEAKHRLPKKHEKKLYKVTQGLIYHPFAGGAKSLRRRGNHIEGRLHRVAYHRLVVEADINSMSVEALITACRNDPKTCEKLMFLRPEDIAVHHKDGDHTNNSRTNLEQMTHAEHWRLEGRQKNFTNFGYGEIEQSGVQEVAYCGEEETYDVICDDPHRNFVANGIVVHNCGKTICFASIIDSKQPGRALVLAHREELIWQARDKIKALTGLESEIEMADLAASPDLFRRTPVTIATVQTLNSGRDQKRMGRFKPEDFDVMIIDEAHHATADSYQNIINYFSQNPNLRIVGCTATPDRADEEALGQVFQSVAFDYEILDAIHDGWLVSIEQQMVGLKGLDYSHIRTTAGDLNGADLAAVMEAEGNLQGIAGASIEIIGTRRAIVFASSVVHAELLCNIFNRHKMGSASWVCGATPKDQRRMILSDFSAGVTQIVCNVGVLTEGFDDPGVEVIVMGRPTKSRSLYAQCLDSQTEILTQRGWKNMHTILRDDIVAGFDIMTEAIEWCSIRGSVFRNLGPGESMWGISSPTADVRVTNMHAMVARRSIGRLRYKSPWAKRLADECDGSFEIPCAGLNRLNLSEQLISDDELKFIGWVLTDGSINKKTNQITITQGEHQPWLSEMEKCIKGCGLKYTKSAAWRKTQFRQTSRCVKFTISRGKPRGRGVHLKGWDYLSKYLDKNISPDLFGLSARQFGVLMRIIHLGDGNKQKAKRWTQRSYHISCGNNKTFADRLQALCVFNGFSCNISPVKRDNSICWTLHAKPSRVRSLRGSSSDSRPTWGPLPYSCGEKVWCVENRLGTLVTRRNGKVAIVGNCIGRSTRPLPGLVDGLETPEQRKLAIATSRKPNCLVVDFVGNSGRHKLVTSADILGGKVSDRAIDRAKMLADKLGKPVRMSDLLDQAENDINKETEERKREEERRKAQIIARVQYNSQKVNPFDVLEITPTRERGWDHGKQLSEKQRAILMRQGIDPDSMPFGQSRQLLNEIFRRWNTHECTFGQAKVLKRFGVDTKGLQMKEASSLLDRIKANGWKLPADYKKQPEPQEADVPF